MSETFATSSPARTAAWGRADCLVVMYHYLRPAAGSAAPAIPACSTDDFESQLQRLAAEREIVPIEDFVEYLDGNTSLPAQSAVLTFDDGLMDHYEHVLPVLQRLGLRGAFFVPTDSVEHRRLDAAHANHLLLAKLPVDELWNALKSAVRKEAPGRDLDSFIDRACALKLFHYESESRAVYKYAVAFGLPIPIRDRVLDQLFAEHVGDPADYAARWYPTWAQLAEMQAAGMHVGGHSHRHHPYPRLTPLEQTQDAEECARLLRERLGDSPRTFSYPYGRFNRDSTTAVRSAGFVAAMTTEERLNAGRVNHWEIARVDCIHLDPFLRDRRWEDACAGA